MKFDHLVIVAPSLAEGLTHVRDCIGLAMPEGGRHREMGTRNHLLRLSETAFLEMIAIDPDAVPPSRPRWFGLNDLERVRADWDAGRRLRGFVARTDRLDAVLANHGDLIGEAAVMTRGDLSWRFAVRPDGSWPEDGAAPCVIDWGPRGSPARTLPDLGARLDDLVLVHPDAERVEALHTALNCESPLRIKPGPALRYEARITLPSGVRTLF